MNDTSAICDIRGSAKTLRFEPGTVVADSVTDNTPVWTGNELEPKKIKKILKDEHVAWAAVTLECSF